MTIRSCLHIEARHTMVPEELATDIAGIIGGLTGKAGGGLDCLLDGISACQDIRGRHEVSGGKLTATGAIGNSRQAGRS
jgi:hypothetical protein